MPDFADILSRHPPMGGPIFPTPKHVATYARLMWLRQFLAREEENGKRHPRLQDEHAILEGLVLGMAVQIVHDGRMVYPLRKLNPAAQRVVEKADRWYPRHGGRVLPKRRPRSTTLAAESP